MCVSDRARWPHLLRLLAVILIERIGLEHPQCHAEHTDADCRIEDGGLQLVADQYADDARQGVVGKGRQQYARQDGPGLSKARGQGHRAFSPEYFGGRPRARVPRYSSVAGAQ